jgi:hypothetical protein
MATYTELLSLSGNSDLLTKIRVACVIAAETVRTESEATNNHAARMLWARGVFENPENNAKNMLWAVLAQNKDFTQAQIMAATDAMVQTAVDAAVDLFAV